jgi:hypothetical protein
MILGVAEIMVVANTAGFKKDLEESSAPAFAGFKDDAAVAGEDAGANLRTGVRKEGDKIADDLGDIGSVGGMNLRRGVTEETGKLADDVGKDAEDAGESLHKGMSGGLSKLANLISNTGLPLGGLSTGLEKAGDAAEHTESKASGLGGVLDKVGGVAMVGFAASGLVVAGAAVDIGEKMQTAEASIASASGTTVAAADKIGAAFDGTAFKSRVSPAN